MLVNITKNVNGIPNGTNLRWAWFDESRPDLLTTATSKGTVTVSSNSISINVDTNLTSGSNGFLILSTTDGTVSQCQSNAMPCEVP